MLLDELLAFFQAQGIGTPGTSLFAGSQAVLPAGDGPFTRIIEYGGQPAIRAMRGTVVAEQPRAQVCAHARTYAAARAKAEAAYKACLHANDAGPVALSGTIYLGLTPLQPPFDLGPDENGRAQVAWNLEALKKVSA